MVWLEQHSEPGGSAGYFSRGQPRRSYDAGATQLIECAPGFLQERIFSLAPAQSQTPSQSVFEKIPIITQHWPDLSRSVQLHEDGRVEWTSAYPASEEERREMAVLERFLRICSTEAQWMWNLMSHIPRFPPQNWSDIRRALELFMRVPWQKKVLFPFLFLASARWMMSRHGIAQRGLANDVVSGLLIDTTQSSPEKSPWLAAAMGLSILQRGIYRCRKGMRSYFRPILTSFEEHNGQYKPHSRLVKIETRADGFLITSKNTLSQQESQYLVTGAALLNLTIWDIVDNLVPAEDPIRQSKIYRIWEKRATQESGWGAFAIYALVEDKESWPAHPLYHQIFPRSAEHPALQSSLYVSIPARDDPAHPTGFRVLTATLHTDITPLSEVERELFKQQLKERIESALEVSLLNVETAHPGTFARYTARRAGQVGGVPLKFSNFMFFATPSLLVHPINKRTQLLLVGDTVFPGQGVIACSVSGIIGFERATNLTFRSLLRKYFGDPRS